MNNEMALNQRTHSLKRSEKGRFLGTIQFSMKWKKKSSMVAFFKKKKTTPKRFQRLRTKDEVTWSCLTMNKIFSNWTQKTIYIYIQFPAWYCQHVFKSALWRDTCMFAVSPMFFFYCKLYAFQRLQKIPSTWLRSKSSGLMVGNKTFDIQT